MTQERQARSRYRTGMQKELSEFYNEDIMRWIDRHRTSYDMTWHEISSRITSDTGYRLSPHTYARWMAFERNGR
jgi:hypothetical protein